MSLESLVATLVASEPFERLLLARTRPVVAQAETGEAFVLAGLATALELPVLAITPGPHEAEALVADVDAFIPGRAVLLPAWEAFPYELLSPSPEVAARRAATVRRLRARRSARGRRAGGRGRPRDRPDARGRPRRSSSPRATRPRPTSWRTAWSRSGTTGPTWSSGAASSPSVAAWSTSSPADERRPVRFEFWGDEIESIRRFVPSTQLSSDRVERATVGPARELIVDDDVRERARAAAASVGDDRVADLLARIGDGALPGGDRRGRDLPVGHDAHAGRAAPRGLVGRRHRGATHARASASDPRRRGGRGGGARLAGTARRAVAGRCARRRHPAAPVRLHGRGRTSRSAAGVPRPAIRARLAGQARDLVALGYRVVVAAHGHGSLDRAREVLGDLELEAVEAPLAAGFVFGPGKIAVLTEEDLFGARRFTREAPRFASRRSDSVADELEPGDFAVHRIHGVGRYQGIVHRELAGSERDYLVLEYAKGDKLYVPSDAVGMVARYIGGDVPRVHRMGGSDWARATAKVKRAVRDMAGELVRLYTVRMSVPGHAFGPDTPWQRELEDAFPYEETPDQLRVIDDVKRDMEKPLPMDRLLCGDVGFGKTEVAVRAACKAVMEGKQAAVLVPTTLLAEQHLLTFRERFAPYPVRVEMLSRFVDPERQDAILADLAQGRVDIVIGTHRLLGRDVALRRPRPADRRRGAALRRVAQGAVEVAARAGRRAHDDRHADPTHARDGADRHPADEHDRHTAGGPPARAHVRRVVRRGARRRRRPA